MTKKCAKENGELNDITFEFANELSQELSDVLSGKVCGLTGLIVAEVLESYVTQIRQSKCVLKDVAGGLLYAMYMATQKQEVVTMNVPINLDEGED